VDASFPTGSAFPRLGDEALANVAAALADLYEALYGERPLDARASLTANMLAWNFEEGLGVFDRGMLKHGCNDELREFREQFFDVVGNQMRTTVGDLTGVPVTYSFFGFDARTRTTHGVFVLDLRRSDDEQRRALVGWSEQVRRNSKRLRAEHRATRAENRELKEEVRRRREEIVRKRRRAET
jgi:uncharacterized protein YbcI